jgi:hypothetical protein
MGQIGGPELWDVFLSRSEWHRVHENANLMCNIMCGMYWPYRDKWNAGVMLLECLIVCDVVSYQCTWADCWDIHGKVQYWWQHSERWDQNAKNAKLRDVLIIFNGSSSVWCLWHYYPPLKVQSPEWPDVWEGGMACWTPVIDGKWMHENAKIDEVLMVQGLIDVLLGVQMSSDVS